MFTKFIETARNYSYNKLKNDFSAAFTVATITIPQNMAYALIAGLSPIYGLYTSIVSMFIATIFGFSSYMIVGPTNIMTVAIASSLNFIEEKNYLQAVFLLTFLVGVIQLLLGLLKSANLVNYISQSVITGLTTGVAFLIGVGQLDNLLGLQLKNSYNVFTGIYSLFNHLHQINYNSLFIGIITISIIIIFKKISTRIPSYLITVLLIMLICYIFQFNQLQMVQGFSSSLPKFNLFSFDFSLIKKLSSPAFSLALLGFIQTMSIVKGFEKKVGEEIELNSEFMGQGIINIICSFFESFAITGSFTNSYANYEAGARTKFSQLFTGLIILISVLILKPFVKYIPLSCLAAIVILIAYSMIDIKEIIHIFHTTKFDTIILLTTFITTISTPRLDYAVFFGVIISFILVLKSTSKTDCIYYSYYQEDKNIFQKKDTCDIDNDNYLIINLSGTLHFNSANNLKDKLNESFRKGKTYLIRWREVQNIDITTIVEIDKFVDRVQISKGEVLFCGVNDELFNTLLNYGLIDKINEENVFQSKDYIFSSTKDAIDKVKTK